MDREQVLKVATFALKVIVGLCVVNFLIYFAGTMVLNGDALNSGLSAIAISTSRAIAAPKRSRKDCSTTADGTLRSLR